MVSSQQISRNMWPIICFVFLRVLHHNKKCSISSVLFGTCHVHFVSVCSWQKQTKAQKKEKKKTRPPVESECPISGQKHNQTENTSKLLLMCAQEELNNKTFYLFYRHQNKKSKNDLTDSEEMPEWMFAKLDWQNKYQVEPSFRWYLSVKKKIRAESHSHMNAIRSCIQIPVLFTSCKTWTKTAQSGYTSCTSASSSSYRRWNHVILSMWMSQRRKEDAIRWTWSVCGIAFLLQDWIST